MPTARPTCRALALSAAIAIAMALSACGDDAPSSNQPTDEDRIRQTVVDWYSAVARADGRRLCALATPAARKASAKEGPSVVIEGGKVQTIPATCSARMARQARASVVDKGIAPGVSNAEVRKVDVLDDRANAITRLGKGEQVMALTKVGSRWLVSGFPQ
jgi:hypothetical protein